MISVIIPVYNNEKYIARCLDSLLAQTYSDFEALVINDGSADHSGEIIKEYAARDSRVHYFEQRNQGVSMARNKGLDNAMGKYVLFLDGDDWLDADVLERLYSAAENDDLDCVSYTFRHIYEDGTPDKEDGKGNDISYLLTSPSKAARFFDTTARHVFYTSQQHLFKREIIEKNQLRFARGIRRGEDILFAHMYAVFICKGIIFGSFNGYNYYHHSESSFEKNTNIWKDVILQNFKTQRFFANFLKSCKKTEAGKYFQAVLAWETILHMTLIEKETGEPQKLKRFLKTNCFRQEIVGVIWKYGKLKRKIMVSIYLFSRKLFRMIIHI